jgi:hypothetical protein
MLLIHTQVQIPAVTKWRGVRYQLDQVWLKTAEPVKCPSVKKARQNSAYERHFTE